MDINEYLKQWSEKLSIPIEQIKTEFDKMLLDEKKIHPDSDEDQQTKRALQRLRLVYKKQLRTPAVGFEGIIIGTSDCVDVVRNRIATAKKLFIDDPQTAIADGITDEEGTPLDTKANWKSGKPNPNYGKPLPAHSYLRNIYGIIKKSNSEEIKMFSMSVNDAKAEDETIPIMKPIRFMAIDKSVEGSLTFQLNASQFTNFAVDEKMILPRFDNLILNIVGITKMSELESYHTLNKDDFNRLVVVEGDVSTLNLEPTAFGSRVMSIEDADASMDDLDAKGLTCWIPERIKIDFAEGSKVIVIGRTGQGKKKDEQGNPTEELSDITMNVFGIFAIPEYKIKLPDSIEEIEKQDLDI